MIVSVGITGGIGSGKTTIAKVFERLGYEVYYADDRAKALYHESKELKADIIRVFGPETYTETGKLNRTYLASKVFPNPELLQELNSIVHPAVRSDFVSWREQASKNSSKLFVLKEAAILFETGTYKDNALNLLVYAPQNLRIERVAKRDGASETAIVQRMNRQMTDHKKSALADFVLYNDGVHPLIPQVLDAERFILTKIAEGF